MQVCRHCLYHSVRVFVTQLNFDTFPRVDDRMFHVLCVGFLLCVFTTVNSDKEYGPQQYIK